VGDGVADEAANAVECRDGCATARPISLFRLIPASPTIPSTAEKDHKQNDDD
jgi:hypothetical protein